MPTMLHSIPPSCSHHQASRTQLQELLRSSWASGTLSARSQRPYISAVDWERHGIDGSITWERAAPLAQFVDMCKPKHMLEVGSFLGLSSNFFLRVMEPWGGKLTSVHTPPARMTNHTPHEARTHVWSVPFTIRQVDPNVRHRVFDAPRDFYERMNGGFMHGDGTSTEGGARPADVAPGAGTPPRLTRVDGFWRAKDSFESGHWDYQNRPPILAPAELEKIFAARPVVRPEDLGRSFDMAFVDGAHEEAAVRGDFESLMHVLQPGACVIFDDVDAATWSGTASAVRKIGREAARDGTGLMLYGDGTALFVDQGYIDARTRAPAPAKRPELAKQPELAELEAAIDRAGGRNPFADEFR